MSVLQNNFTFIDLFAGIGGFHIAMHKYSSNSQCVFSSEINPLSKKVYYDNLGMMPDGDIRLLYPESIGRYDVLCGGFPCQAFSHAGKQNGFMDPRGTLFYEIIRFLKFAVKHNGGPKIVMLENVSNLVAHDGGKTWATIKYEISSLGYNVIDRPLVVGPNDYGIPQLRDRALILAVRSDLLNVPIVLDPPRVKTNTLSIFTIVDNDLSQDELNELTLSQNELRILNIWNEFIKGVQPKVIGFPIWSDVFGTNDDISQFPKWKQDYVIKNRHFYDNNKAFIDKWLKKNRVRESLNPTQRKFEWQVSNKINDIFDGIIQFRPSGVRVKQPTEAPALVALVQVPIIGRFRRYLSVKEAIKLQSFPNNYRFHCGNHTAYSQLGNAVNVNVIYNVFTLFVQFIDEKMQMEGCANVKN